jgi:trypsin
LVSSRVDNMFKLIVSIAFFALCTGSPTAVFLDKPRLGDTGDSRIVGGFVIDIEQAPHQVSLQSFGSHICGGSIIAKTWVLTAAHCTSGSSASRLSVRIGSSKFSSGGELIKVKRIVQHEKYNGNNIDFDFSLLELAEEVVFDETRRTIALPKQDEPVEDGTLCEVSGWGNTQSSGESNKILRAALVPSVNQEECDDAYADFGGVTPRMICAGFKAGGKDACQGDSGGELEG